MAFHSPRQSQNLFQYNSSTPPPPPPKPSAHSSGRGTPQTGPPLPPPPGHVSQNYYDHSSAQPSGRPQGQPDQDFLTIPPPEDGWLPDALKDKTTVDLHHVLENPELQRAILHSPETAHPSLPASTAPLRELLAQNIALAESLKSLESHLRHQQESTQARLLSLKALERQWRAKQAEQDAALREFSPPSLYQRLSAAVSEQEALCRGLEESFLEGEGDNDAVASEREVTEFVRRLRDGWKTAYLRAERKERWDEGRVGGWR